MDTQISTDNAARDFVQHLYHLTSNDILMWELEYFGTDCKYIAFFNGITFRLGCNPRCRYFFINDMSLDIGPQATLTLCQLILSQRTRHPDTQKIAKIAEMNKMFEVTLGYNNKTG